MTGRAFFRFISKRGIPLSCIATKLNCKLATLKQLEKVDVVPTYYIQQFLAAFKPVLNERELEQLGISV